VYLRVGASGTCTGWRGVWYLRGKRPKSALEDGGTKILTMEAEGGGVIVGSRDRLDGFGLYGKDRHFYSLRAF